jgi:hypothetical protein
VGGTAVASPDALDRITDAIKASKLAIRIAATFPIEQIRYELTLQGGGHVHGKVVVGHERARGSADMSRSSTSIEMTCLDDPLSDGGAQRRRMAVPRIGAGANMGCVMTTLLAAFRGSRGAAAVGVAIWSKP